MVPSTDGQFGRCFSSIKATSLVGVCFRNHFAPKPRSKMTGPLLLLFLFIHFCSSQNVNHEVSLREELFTRRKVDNHTRPRQGVNDTTDVMVDLLVFHIVELDERSEVLTINAWMGHRWQDLNLAWKTEDYGGLMYLPVRQGQIWFPDIYLLNSAQASNVNPAAQVPGVVVHDGTIWWWPPSTFKSVCPIDLSAFPFDEQTCNLIFVSWSYSGHQVNLSMFSENRSLTNFLYDEHNEWEEVWSHGNRSIFFYGNEGEYNYQELNFYIHLRRRAPYYRLALVVPVVVAILTNFVIFWIPPSEKQLVGGINLVILAILIVHLYWVVPRSGSNLPGIVVLCGNALLFAGLTLIVSIATTSLRRQSPKSSPPSWLKNLLGGWLGLIFCLDTTGQQSSSAGQLLTNEDDNPASEESLSTSTEWNLVAVAVDRLAFILYSIAICAVLIAAFA